VTGTPSAVGADLLATILAATRRIVEFRQQREPAEALARRADRAAPRPGAFRDALGRTDRVNVIGECKRRSPSRGVLRRDYVPATIAGGYEAAGAAAISVLTEPTFFDGGLKDLRAVRETVSLPLLRKDFIVCDYQLLEARAEGADAVLLIVAALAPQELQRLARRAKALGLDALVEVHTEDEAAVAVDAGAEIIGVNNRNLRTLSVDVRASERIVPRLPKGVVAVSESGLKTPDDLTRLRGLGYHAFLIGERFMMEPDPGIALRGLLEATRPASGRG
jgi:indole-3-glycerol phosphate synthase